MAKPTEKKEFEKKFEPKNGKWEPKSNEGWQTKGGAPFPVGANKEIEPWADSLRTWMFEMSQWARTVDEYWNDMEERMSDLDKKVTPATSRLNDLEQQLSQVSQLLQTLKRDVNGLQTRKTV